MRKHQRQLHVKNFAKIDRNYHKLLKYDQGHETVK